MSKNRYIGEFPVIGIRPTIDGRRGALDVRGSLEEQTMNMAKSAAALFEQNLKYVNGDPVKVVIADTTIGRVAEAAACEAKFKKEGVDVIVDAVNGDLKNLRDRFKAMLQVSENYKSFSGIADDTDGKVDFIFKTDSISPAKDEDE